MLLAVVLFLLPILALVVVAVRVLRVRRTIGRGRRRRGLRPDRLGRRILRGVTGAGVAQVTVVRAATPIAAGITVATGLAAAATRTFGATSVRHVLGVLVDRGVVLGAGERRQGGTHQGGHGGGDQNLSHTSKYGLRFGKLTDRQDLGPGLVPVVAMPQLGSTTSAVRQRTRWARFAHQVTERWSEIGPAAASVAVPFVLVVYLALQGGGYDAILRGEVGVAVWWIVLLASLVGIFPLVRLSRGAQAALGLLVAFTVWTAFALLWTE